MQCLSQLLVAQHENVLVKLFSFWESSPSFSRVHIGFTLPMSPHSAVKAFSDWFATFWNKQELRSFRHPSYTSRTQIWPLRILWMQINNENFCLHEIMFEDSQFFVIDRKWDLFIVHHTLQETKFGLDGLCECKWTMKIFVCLRLCLNNEHSHSPTHFGKVVFCKTEPSVHDYQYCKIMYNIH